MNTFFSEPDSATLSGKVSRTEGPAPEQWDAHRSKIKALYNDYTLKVVRATMQRDHNFVATEKMYKTRIRQWGLEKKCKASEMSCALRIIERRRAEGKKTYVVIRERVMDERDIQKYFKRQRKTVRPQKLRRNGMNGRLSPEIRSFTPPGTSLSEEAMDDDGDSVPSSTNSAVQFRLSRGSNFSLAISDSGLDLEASAARPSNYRPRDSWTQKGEGVGGTISRGINHADLLQLMYPSACDLTLLPSVDGTSCHEVALKVLGNYYLHYFESSQWEPWAREHLSRNANNHSHQTTSHGSGSGYTSASAKRKVMFPHIEFEDPGRVVASVEVAIHLYGTPGAKEGDLLMDTAFEKLSVLLREEHPQLLSCFLLLLGVLDSAGLFGLVKKLLFHTHDLSQIVLGTSHPITRLASWLARSEDRDGLVDCAFECIATLYRDHAGDLHPQYLEALHHRAWLNLQRNRYSEAQEALEKLYQLYQQYADPTDVYTRGTLYSMAGVHIAQESFSTADFLLAEVERRTALRFGNGYRSEMMLECARMRAELWRYQGLETDSDGMIKQALNDAEAFLDDENPFVILSRYTLPQE
jgi:tetratricopeptide (TPR) repeat protein